MSTYRFLKGLFAVVLPPSLSVSPEFVVVPLTVTLISSPPGPAPALPPMRLPGIVIVSVALYPVPALARLILMLALPLTATMEQA